MDPCSSSADLQMAFLANMDIQHTQCDMKSFYCTPFSGGGGGGLSYGRGGDARRLA